MHFHIEAAVRASTREEALEEVVVLMAPHYERYWDWFEIGGRWRGEHLRAGGITDDLPMLECDLCMGTGERPGGREEFGDSWYDWCNGCNGCKGVGKRLAWSTQWGPHESDVMHSVDPRVRADLTCYALLSEEGGWEASEEIVSFDAGFEVVTYTGTGTPDRETVSEDASGILIAKRKVTIPREEGLWLVTVDAHN